MKGEERHLCERCGKNRPLKWIWGIGLPPKGLNMCRSCFTAFKFALRAAQKEEAEKYENEQ